MSEVIVTLIPILPDPDTRTDPNNVQIINWDDVFTKLEGDLIASSDLIESGSAHPSRKELIWNNNYSNACSLGGAYLPHFRF